MRRRDFVKLAGLSAGGAAASGSSSLAGGNHHSANRGTSDPSSIIVVSEDEHRQRLRTIAECNRTIRTCLSRHLVVDYIPGQAMYNLGEYPSTVPWRPEEQDEKNLDELKAHGIGLVQVHEEWNDSQRLFGGDKFTAVNEKGFRRFVDWVHRRGMKIIAYISTGYFDRRDPDFRNSWARPPDLVELHYQYAGCSPQSPGWRAYMLARALAVMDRYGLDGLYNDLGQRPLYRKGIQKAEDDVLAFEEKPEHDAALEDLLGILYGEVKKRGGLVKVHHGGSTAPKVLTTVYDYLWVGEAVADGDRLRQQTKHHRPYVVPCLDMSRARISREDDLYLQTIPYMQFPILLAGRPFTGERALVPGIKYQPEEKDFWTRHCRNIYRYWKSHPEGPFSYGWWDSSPGRPEARPTHFRWLKLYRPMVKSGTQAYLEIGENQLFKHPLPDGLVASVFANTELYLVLANYTSTSQFVETSQSYYSCLDDKAAPASAYEIPARSLLILKRRV